MGGSRIRKIPIVSVVGIIFLGIGFLCATERTTNPAKITQGDFMLPWVPTPASISEKSHIDSDIAPSNLEEKLNQSLANIFEGRYELAVSKCEDALRIDPSNATAIGRMGSAFYLDGEMEKAITLWKRALEIEPNNQTAINYLRKL